jgi:hypothetical protein
MRTDYSTQCNAIDHCAVFGVALTVIVSTRTGRFAVRLNLLKPRNAAVVIER